jgi:DNA-binding CsgD family transcriptional regulator
MRLIASHIRRAVLIGKVLDLKKAQAATFADGLDGIGAGIFFVDATRHIVHANIAGRAILGKADVLRVRDGRLVVCDPQADQTLADIFASAANGNIAPGIKGVALPLTDGKAEKHVCHVLPLTSRAPCKAGISDGAVAVLFVHKAAIDAPSNLEAIATAYRLTPTEMRVLLSIVQVGGAPEVAEALGVSAETVKTHLRNLYAKTGAGRQADLVKVAAGFANPLIRQPPALALQREAYP